MNYKLIVVSALLALQATATFGALEPLPDAGLTPDSILYFTKAWKEQIQSFFTFGLENQARQFLHLAEVRLAEYKKMAEAKKDELAQKTLNKFDAQLGRAIEKISELKKDKKDTSELEKKVDEVRAEHIDALRENIGKASEQARPELVRALGISQKALNLSLAEKDIEAESEEPKGDEVIFNIMEGNASGMSGVAMLEPRAGKTRVSVRLASAPKGITQPTHLHMGSCPDVGAVKYPLASLVNGKSETLLDVSLDKLKSELPLALNVHLSAKEIGVYVACGNLSF